jgi:hypothetical protein
MEQTISRRVMLPETARRSPEAADAEDARKIRYGFSPSYYINLGSLSGNRWTGYAHIYPRILYRFEQVHPTGINESPDRLDEEKGNLPAYLSVSRSPRTCAEDVKSVAQERVFAILNSLTDRPDAQDIWDVIYPVEAEAEIWSKTDRAIRGPLPDHLRHYYEQAGLEPPYVRDGHALALFIEYLERSAPPLVRGEFTGEMLEVAESCVNEMLQAANDAFIHRYSRLHASFGSMETRKNNGQGKNKLDGHDWQCIAETGIEKPEDKPVLASQKMGEAIGDQIAERSAHSEGQLAEAVRELKDSQLAMQREAAEDRKLMLEILRQSRK